MTDTDLPLGDAAQSPAPVDLKKLEERIGHRFENGALLLRAITHPSWSQQYPEDEHNQRLEFLGDSVLSLVLAGELYKLMPNKREGVLTRNRAALAKGAQLAKLAQELELDVYLRLSESEERNGGRMRASILEDAVEAVIGAVYLDSDFEHARSIVLHWYGDLRRRLDSIVQGHNPKGQLQELVQPTLGNDAICYAVTNEEGPPHQRSYEVSVSISGQVKGVGCGSSKKEAEENAAREALKNLMPDIDEA